MKGIQTLGEDSQKSVLDKRLEDIGWGLFLIATGCILLVPANIVPQGTWLIGTGLIMLGLNGVRYFKGIKMHGFTLILGLFALVAGLGDLLQLKLPLFAIFVIFIGVSIILKPLLTKGSWF
jgi:hypothetical protein